MHTDAERTGPSFARPLSFSFLALWRPCLPQCVHGGGPDGAAATALADTFTTPAFLVSLTVGALTVGALTVGTLAAGPAGAARAHPF